MANNMKEIQDRMDTVKGTSQITNAMKLVSMAKFQQYSRKAGVLDEFVKDIQTLPNHQEDRQTIDRQRSLAICFSADLGLASMYHKSLFAELVRSGIEHVVWIGGKFYDKICEDERFDVLNEEMSSEDVDINQLFDQVLEWMNDYEIFIARPRLSSGDSVTVEWQNADDHLSPDPSIEFYPSYEAADKLFVELKTLAVLYESFYHSKVVEHTIRRLAMDTATDNAEALHAELQLQYNRLRQEQITQEILELSSGMESR